MYRDRIVPKVALHNHYWDFLPYLENSDKCTCRGQNYTQSENTRDGPYSYKGPIVPLCKTLL